MAASGLGAGLVTKACGNCGTGYTILIAMDGGAWYLCSPCWRYGIVVRPDPEAVPEERTASGRSR